MQQQVSKDFFAGMRYITNYGAQFKSGSSSRIIDKQRAELMRLQLAIDIQSPPRRPIIKTNPIIGCLRPAQTRRKRIKIRNGFAILSILAAFVTFAFTVKGAEKLEHQMNEVNKYNCNLYAIEMNTHAIKNNQRPPCKE